MRILNSPTRAAFQKYMTRMIKFAADFPIYIDLANNRYANLVAEAIRAQKEKARTFKTAVGAAVQAKNGMVFSGGNVEHLERSLDDHAEKRAILAAVEAGHEKEDLLALALVYGSKITREAGEYAYPACALCRQIMWDEAHPNLLVIVADPDAVVTFAGPLWVLYPLPYPAKVPERLKLQ